MQQRENDLILEEGMESNLTDEEILSLYEAYMDEDEIQSIIDQDSKEELQLFHTNTKYADTKYSDSMTISINDFVTQYLWLGYTPAKAEDERLKKKIEREDRRVNKDYNRTTKHYKLLKNEIAQSTDEDMERAVKEYSIKQENINAASSKERINIKNQPGRSYTLGTYNYGTLWHSGLKDIGSPYLFIVGNDYANKNVDKVYDGELLLVTDAKKNTRTYINPFLIEQLLNADKTAERLKVVKARLYGSGCKDFHEFLEYYNEERFLEKQIKENEKTKKILIETHKDRNFRRLKEGMKRA